MGKLEDHGERQASYTKDGRETEPCVRYRSVILTDMQKRPLTRRQQAIYDRIRRGIEAGQAPSLSELARYFQLSSKATVHQHVDALVKKGYLKKNWNGELRLAGGKTGAGEIQSLPLYGNIPASPPREMFPDAEMIEVPSMFLGDGEHFALKVRGESMAGAGVHDGDLAFVRRQESAESGQIVAASIDGEMTLKRLSVRKGDIFLCPENPEFDPICVSRQDELKIHGVLVSVFRRFS